MLVHLAHDWEIGGDKGLTASSREMMGVSGTRVRQKVGLSRSILSAAGGQFEGYLADCGVAEKIPAAYTSQICNECRHGSNADTKCYDQYLDIGWWPPCENRMVSSLWICDLQGQAATWAMGVDVSKGSYC